MTSNFSGGQTIREARKKRGTRDASHLEGRTWPWNSEYLKYFGMIRIIFAGCCCQWSLPRWGLIPLAGFPRGWTMAHHIVSLSAGSSSIKVPSSWSLVGRLPPLDTISMILTASRTTLISPLTFGAREPARFRSEIKMRLAKSGVVQDIRFGGADLAIATKGQGRMRYLLVGGALACALLISLSTLAWRLTDGNSTAEGGLNLFA